MRSELPERVICEHQGAAAGPLLVCIGSIHGNEPAGVEAIQRISQEIASLAPEMRGRFIGLRGNLRAIQEGVRFVDEDLNRSWHIDRICKKTGRLLQKNGTCEDRELEDLSTYLINLRNAEDNASPIWLLDLHTTSGSTVPFLWALPVQEGEQALDILPMPTVHDGIPRIDGTLVGYAVQSGFRPFCFEGGSHNDPRSVDRLHAIIWLMMSRIEMFPSEQGNSSTRLVRDMRKYLSERTKEIPNKLTIFYHHMISPEDEFQMKPGYTNFQEVSKGELLAHDRNGPIYAKGDGRILMPLYQLKGEDGFLLVR